MSRKIAVVAPWGRDAGVIVSILRSAALEASPVILEELLEGIATSAYDAAIITQEALATITPDALGAGLARQPDWSDFPFVLLAGQAAGCTPSRIVETLGNVIQVERPLHAATLVRCAHAALRGRERQHATEHLLERQRLAERRISELAQGLEQRVVERTAELKDAYAQLEQEMHEKEEAQAKLRQMQAGLVQISRVSAANMMASTIAHELNQPLAATLNYLRGTERLLRRMEASDEIVSAVDAAARNAHRAGEIIRHLRELVSSAPVRRAPERIAEIIENARRLVFLDPDEDLVIVEAIPGPAERQA